MNILKNKLNQKVTIWTPGTVDEFGKPIFVQTFINGRFESYISKDFTEESMEVVSNTILYSLSEIKTGSYIKEGVYSTTATPPIGSKIIGNVTKVIDLRGKTLGYISWL